MLTAADDFPIHQRPEPIAFAGTDRNFYDRYFFNAQAPDGSAFLAAALGVYPHLNLIDAAVSWLADGAQRSVFVSRILHHDRMATHVGPIAVRVEQPLVRLAVALDETDGLAARLRCTGLHPPIEEPRFTRRIAGRTLMDSTRMTQNVRWEGTVVVDDTPRRIDGWQGTRDRSWGIRPIGAADAQPVAPPLPPQFFWLWAPLVFPGHSLFAHTNDDEAGAPWNRSAVLVDHATGTPSRLVDPGFQLRFRPGTRRVANATITASVNGAPLQVSLAPETEFQMAGIGYGHPSRAHGSFHGPLSVHSERTELGAVDPAIPLNAHVQALVSATLTLPDGSRHAGRGVLEQLLIGPHAPCGFQALFDHA